MVWRGRAGAVCRMTERKPVRCCHSPLALTRITIVAAGATRESKLHRDGEGGSPRRATFSFDNSSNFLFYVISRGYFSKTFNKFCVGRRQKFLKLFKKCSLQINRYENLTIFLASSLALISPPSPTDHNTFTRWNLLSKLSFLKVRFVNFWKINFGNFCEIL